MKQKAFQERRIAGANFQKPEELGLFKEQNDSQSGARWVSGHVWTKMASQKQAGPDHVGPCCSYMVETLCDYTFNQSHLRLLGRGVMWPYLYCKDFNLTVVWNTGFRGVRVWIRGLLGDPDHVMNQGNSDEIVKALNSYCTLELKLKDLLMT